jgi:phosphopantothenoylcysteine decarboxylase/phosphopantothenate--cysteine ligase
VCERSADSRKLIAADCWRKAAFMARSRRMLITAGPTREPIDAVRYIANRSSGRMGVALAEAARDAGWNVTLLLGPVSLDPPAGVQIIPFESTADLAELLEEHFPACDVLIMAAAVADYRPRRASAPQSASGPKSEPRRVSERTVHAEDLPPDRKLPRYDQPLVLELEPTPDLVAQCTARKRPDQRIIGFALEQSTALAERAREKLARKGLDAIVGNPLSTMGAADVTATVFTATGGVITLPGPRAASAPVSKGEFARRLIEWVDAAW